MIVELSTQVSIEAQTCPAVSGGGGTYPASLSRVPPGDGALPPPKPPLSVVPRGKSSKAALGGSPKTGLAPSCASRVSSVWAHPNGWPTKKLVSQSRTPSKAAALARLLGQTLPASFGRRSRSSVSDLAADNRCPVLPPGSQHCRLILGFARPRPSVPPATSNQLPVMVQVSSVVTASVVTAAAAIVGKSAPIMPQPSVQWPRLRFD